MGFFGSIARIGAKVVTRPLGTAASKIVRNPVVRSLARETAIGAALYSAGSALSSSKASPGMPPFPATGGLPALPGAGAPPIVGDRGWFQNDPNIVAALQPWAIAKTNLRTSYRSPLKGFVIRYDSAGDPFAIPKKLAAAYLGWKPSKKPPISVGEYQALKKADRTAKKVKKILGMVSRVDRNIGKGGKVIVHKKKGK